VFVAYSGRWIVPELLALHDPMLVADVAHLGAMAVQVQLRAPAVVEVPVALMAEAATLVHAVLHSVLAS